MPDWQREKLDEKPKIDYWRESNFQGATTDRFTDTRPLWQRLGLSEPIVLKEIQPRETISCMFCDNVRNRCDARFCVPIHCDRDECRAKAHPRNVTTRNDASKRFLELERLFDD